MVLPQMQSSLFPHNPQTSASLFLPGTLFPSLHVSAQSKGAEGQGGMEGRSWGSLAAGGPILLPQPSLLCRHQDFSCVPWVEELRKEKPLFG